MNQISHVKAAAWPIPLGLVLAAVAAGLSQQFGLASAASWTAAVTVLCACWWMTEALPLPATALIPLAVFPLTGVLSSAQIAHAYGNPLILLFLGGFLLSRAMESSGAHRRIALTMVRKLGGSSSRLVLGFLCASALLSMWISNTATALMLLPVALAITQTLDDARLRIAVLLAVAYGCSMGGLGTPIGSPPNLIFLQVYQEHTGIAISFLQWMSLGLPLVILFIPIAGLWLTRNIHSQASINLPESGPLTSAQRRVLLIFCLTALAWITRSDPFGGWSQWLNLPQANDASVALLGAISLFIIPDRQGERLLSWEAARKIPWGMLILFGGGIAIAKAFASSGLSTAFGDLLATWVIWPPLLLILLISLSVTMLTEINSNTATAVLILPILAAAAIATKLDPILLMLPATFSASCAFMLPVATPPNAIVFGSGQLTMRDMMREGLVLNLIGSLLITGWCYLRL